MKRVFLFLICLLMVIGVGTAVATTTTGTDGSWSFTGDVDYIVRTTTYDPLPGDGVRYLSSECSSSEYAISGGGFVLGSPSVVGDNSGVYNLKGSYRNAAYQSWVIIVYTPVGSSLTSTYATVWVTCVKQG